MAASDLKLLNNFIFGSPAWNSYQGVDSDDRDQCQINSIGNELMIHLYDRV